MNAQRQNDLNIYYHKTSRLEDAWDELQNRLGILLYQSKQKRDFVMAGQLTKLLTAMYKNKPTKQLLRSIEQRVEKIEKQSNNDLSRTR